MTKYLIVAGPTASGKTELALWLSSQLQGEIVCGDSVQLYHGFNIGASSPTSEELSCVRHHLFGSLSPSEDCDAARFSTLARSAMAEIASRQRLPIVVGGSGLYLRSLIGQAWHDNIPSCQELKLKLRQWPTAVLVLELSKRDPKRLRQIHIHDRFRLIRALEINMLTGKTADEVFTEKTEDQREAVILLLMPPRAVLHQRIDRRSRLMLENGLIDEVKGLLTAGVDPTSKPMQSIGYRQVVDYLEGKIAKVELHDRIAAATRQYAKRQCTWFRKLKADLVIDKPRLCPSQVERVGSLLSGQTL